MSVGFWKTRRDGSGIRGRPRSEQPKANRQQPKGKSQKRKAKSQRPKAKSEKRKAKSEKRKAESRKPKAESRKSKVEHSNCWDSVYRGLDRRLGWAVGRLAPRVLAVAVITDLIPPRMLKSPTTCIQRGLQAAARSSRIRLTARS